MLILLKTTQDQYKDAKTTGKMIVDAVNDQLRINYLEGGDSNDFSY